MVGPAAKREGVAHLQAVMGLSERWACSIVDADRKMIRYRPCRPPDTDLRTQLRDLANARRRFGYRRLFILLRQDGDLHGPRDGAGAHGVLVVVEADETGLRHRGWQRMESIELAR